MSRTALLLLALGAIACLVQTVCAASVTGSRVAVVLDSLADQQTYSRFWTALEARDFNVSYHAASVDLFTHGERASDHLVLFTSSKGLKGALSVANIVQYINDGGNVLMATDAGMSDSHRELAYELGVEFDDSDTLVQDHFHHHSARVGNKRADASYVLSKHMVADTAVVSDAVRASGSVMFHGVAHKLIAPDNYLLHTVLSAERTAVTGEPNRPLPKEPFAAGSGIGLVSALQARNNARVVLTGSLQMFSDQFLKAQGESGVSIINTAFVEQVSRWTFHEKSVLRVANTKHARAGEHAPRDHYRIKDHIVYNITIQEWNGARWTPYLASDVQFEAIMLDPYIRQTMTTAFVSSSAATYTAKLHLPDVYGVFTFRVDYKRTGLTWLLASELVSIHPYRHDEYPRFLAVAQPYYASAFSQMAAFIVFSVLWLANKDPAAQTKAVPAVTVTASAPTSQTVPASATTRKSQPVQAAADQDDAEDEDGEGDDQELAEAVATVEAIVAATATSSSSSPAKKSSKQASTAAAEDNTAEATGADKGTPSKAKQRKKKGGK
ncbi:oligosaccharyl transferase glycoprotein complex, beta subunit [Sorochytrium milnesiophthora]